MTCRCGCRTFGEHVRSIRFLSEISVREDRRERALSRDLAAYRSLIDQGLEPARIDGCHELVQRDAPAHVIEGRPLADLN